MALAGRVISAFLQEREAAAESGEKTHPDRNGTYFDVKQSNEYVSWDWHELLFLERLAQA